MSIKQMSQVWERADVQQGHLLVLLALADWANDKGVCWPSIPSIARKSRMGVRQVRRILADLESKKIITREEHRGRKGRDEYATNRYKLNLSVCPVYIELKPVTDAYLNLTSDAGKPDICDSAIRKEPSVSTTVIEPSGGMPPEDLPAISFAQRVVEELCLHSEPGIMHAVASAINFCVKFEGKSKSSATEYLVAMGRDEIDRGGAPNRFWFSDRKWRTSNGSGTSKAAERNDRNRANIIQGISGVRAGRDAVPVGAAVPNRHNSGGKPIVDIDADRTGAPFRSPDS